MGKARQDREKEGGWSGTDLFLASLSRLEFPATVTALQCASFPRTCPCDGSDSPSLDPEVSRHDACVCECDDSEARNVAITAYNLWSRFGPPSLWTGVAVTMSS